MTFKTRPLTTCLLLALCVIPMLTRATSSVSLESVTINGSNYFWAFNNGGISPFVLLNASSGNAQWSTAETDDITDALSRQSWLRYGLGFGRLVEGNRFLDITSGDLRNFDVFGFNDSGKWRTEANKSFSLGGRSFSVKLLHQQYEFDDYVNMTMAFQFASGSYTLPVDIYLLLKIEDITRFDKANVNVGNRIYDVPINGSYNFSNASRLMLYGNQSPPSWEYLFETAENSIVVINNGTIWLGYDLGRTISGGFQRSFNAIDANPCATQCGIPDAIVTEISFDPEPDASFQVATNYTVGVRWTDSYGQCTSSNCYLNLAMRDPYAALASTCKMVSGATSGWMACTMSNSSNNCTSVGGTYYATTAKNPAKGAWFNFSITNMGRYSSLAEASHKVSQQLGSQAGGLMNICGENNAASTQVDGMDVAAPTISCTFNGTPIANNSVNDFLPTNGSLAWMNLTVNCTFGDSTKPYGSTGLVNNSFISLNRSGWGPGINVTNLVDDYYGKQGIAYLDVENAKAYSVCAGVNGTNGANDSNWTGNWCYDFSVNIVPSGPVPLVNLSSPVNGSLFVNSSFVNFSCNASGDYSLDAVELWGNWNGGWHANQSFDFDNNSSFAHSFSAFVEDGYFDWNCRFVDVYGLSAFASQNWTVGVENQSRQAIEEGVMNVTPNASIYAGQQVYIVNEYGDHFLGRFDKTTELGNQTWAFNYVTTPLESSTGMPSVKEIVNVWENDTLSLQQIFDQVTAFISSTLLS